MQKHLVAVLATALAAAGLTTTGANPEREIVVQPGDSMRSLSLRYYGDEDHVGAIARYNRLTSPDLIFAGLRLVLPEIPAQEGPVDSPATIDQVAPTPTPTAVTGPAAGNSAGTDAAAVPPLPPAVTSQPALTGPASLDSAPDPSQLATNRPASNATVAGSVIQTGMATWYGPGFSGNVTACGEVFDEWGYTAASNTLPCDTVVVVTNESTGASVTVRITDRGGFGGSMILDLARGAFDVIAPESAGVCSVIVSLPAR